MLESCQSFQDHSKGVIVTTTLTMTTLTMIEMNFCKFDALVLNWRDAVFCRRLQKQMRHRSWAVAWNLDLVVRTGTTTSSSPQRPISVSVLPACVNVSIHHLHPRRTSPIRICIATPVQMSKSASHVILTFLQKLFRNAVVLLPLTHNTLLVSSAFSIFAYFPGVCESVLCICDWGLYDVLRSAHQMPFSDVIFTVHFRNVASLLALCLPVQSLNGFSPHVYMILFWHFQMCHSCVVAVFLEFLVYSVISCLLRRFPVIWIPRQRYSCAEMLRVWLLLFWSSSETYLFRAKLVYCYVVTFLWQDAIWKEFIMN